MSIGMENWYGKLLVWKIMENYYEPHTQPN